MGPPGPPGEDGERVLIYNFFLTFVQLEYINNSEYYVCMLSKHSLDVC